MGADLHFAGTKGGLRSLLWARKRAEKEQHPRFVRFMDEAALGQRQGGAEGRALGVGNEPNGTGRVEIGTGTVGRGQGRGGAQGCGRRRASFSLSLPALTYPSFGHLIWPFVRRKEKQNYRLLLESCLVILPAFVWT